MPEKLVLEAEQAVCESVVGSAVTRATCQGFCWCVNRAAVSSQIPDFTLPFSQPANTTSIFIC